MPKVKLAGNQFGETYHVAGAMLMAPLLPENHSYYNHSISVEQESRAPAITPAQKTFFNCIKLLRAE